MLRLLLLRLAVKISQILRLLRRSIRSFNIPQSDPQAFELLKSGLFKFPPPPQAEIECKCHFICKKAKLATVTCYTWTSAKSYTLLTSSSEPFACKRTILIFWRFKPLTISTFRYITLVSCWRLGTSGSNSPPQLVGYPEGVLKLRTDRRITAKCFDCFTTNR